MHLRSAEELADVADPAWPFVTGLLAAADGAVALPVSRAQGLRVLEALQVTARSVLGALALHCGGLVADHGWFRLYGGGGAGLPDLAQVNGAEPGISPPLLHVGHDVLGGRFAVDGGGLGVARGEVCYFGPDSLEWEPMGGGHGVLVEAALTGALGEMFADLRWPGWEAEVAALPLDRGLSLVPPPWTAEGRNLSAVSRHPVPVAELTSLYEDAARRLGA